MADYTYLNEVPARRIHKINAEDIVIEEQENIKNCTIRLVAMAASHPSKGNTVDWDEAWWEDWDVRISREVPELINSIIESSRREFMAQYIVDNPELVIDELEQSEPNEDANEDASKDELVPNPWNVPWREIRNL